MLWVSLRIAGTAAAVSLVLGLWLAWLLAKREFRGRRELAALVSLALAFPSPVICYYFLSGRPRLWSWGVVLAAIVSAMPLVVRAGRGALAAVDPLYEKAARSLGASDWRIFLRVEAPLIWRSSLGGAALGFARVAAEVAAALLIASRLEP